MGDGDRDITSAQAKRCEVKVLFALYFFVACKDAVKSVRFVLPVRVGAGVVDGGGGWFVYSRDVEGRRGDGENRN